MANDFERFLMHLFAVLISSLVKCLLVSFAGFLIGSLDPCLTVNLKGKTLSLLPLSVMLAVGFLSLLFIKLRKSPFVLSLLKVFFSNHK